jgi:futalosine hydrolase
MSALVLVCAATLDELKALGFDRATAMHELVPGRVYQTADSLFAITGVGIPHTLLSLPVWLAHFKPALIVNGGIAGAYVGSGLELGDVVLGTSDVFADLGMETPDEPGFIPLGAQSFADESLRAPLPLSAPTFNEGSLKRGRGATVNLCTGTPETGRRRRRLFEVDFETMEGAAVALAARAHDIPVLQIRAVSNFAAQRDMRPENVRVALDALASFWTRHGDGLVRAARPEARS